MGNQGAVLKGSQGNVNNRFLSREHIFGIKKSSVAERLV
ncbi:MAG: hypothetical protein ACJAU3_001654 [Zhongshania sp.]|jgi:hypothetical protein